MKNRAVEKAERADFHFHTTMSDGGVTNAEAVERCLTDGIAFAVATEHDVVNREFARIAESAGIRTLEGVEISARAPIGKDKTKHLHLTAYSKKFADGIDPMMDATRNGRKEKMRLQCEKLSSYGFDIDHERFLAEFKESRFDISNLTNFHLAQYLVERESTAEITRSICGVPVTEPHRFIATFLKRESPHPVWVPDNFPEYEPRAEKVARIVCANSAGILSIAHPNFTFQAEGSRKFEESIAENLVEAGANGIELNPFADEEWTNTVLRVRKRFGLILTFGSDCHFLPKKTGDGRHADIGNPHPYLNGKISETVRGIFDAVGQ